jgi:hypothetical protein
MGDAKEDPTAADATLSRDALESAAYQEWANFHLRTSGAATLCTDMLADWRDGCVRLACTVINWCHVGSVGESQADRHATG